MKNYLLIIFCSILAAGCHSKPPDLAGNEGFDTLNPSLTNLPPIAMITVLPEVAEPDQVMTLDGSGSYDPDGTIKTYFWEQIDGEEVVLSDENAKSVSFTVPNVSTKFVFKLTVADQYGSTASAEVSVQVTAVSQPPPEPELKAIFVSASMGSDSEENSGSHLEPVATINYGITRAVQKGLKDVYVMDGTYNEEVVLQSGINLHGSVTAVNSDGTPIYANSKTSTINAVDADNVDEFLVEGFAINGTMVIENSSNGEIDNNSFTISSVAVNALDSDNISIRGNSVTANAQDDAVISAFLLDDVANSAISDNTVNIQGGSVVDGISLYCKDEVVDTTIEHNTFSLNGAASVATAIDATCYQEGSVFHILRNKAVLSPSSAISEVKAKVLGVRIIALMNPLTVEIVNNAILMDAVITGDYADKTAVVLNKPGAGSEIKIIHNTLLVTGGKYAKLYAISSDANNAPLSIKNNILFVFSKANESAVLLLKSTCSSCTDDYENNLTNSNFAYKAMNFVYYSDSKTSVGAQPPGNFSEKLQPYYFDFEEGELSQNYQTLVKDKGLTHLNITTDINGDLRDALPDIGATEY